MSSSCSQPSPAKEESSPTQEVPQHPLLAVLGDKPPKPREAEHLAFGVVGLYQPIAVEERLPRAHRSIDLLLLIAHARHEPKGHPPSP